jgi:hypothetical protein
MEQKKVVVFLQLHFSLTRYKKQRDRLNVLVKEIYERNREHFTSTEEVFRVFAEAVLSGRLLELARLIDQTFGKGAFRKLVSEAA